MTQLLLQLPTRSSSIEVRFRFFHRCNPQVYRTLVSLALAAVQRGKTKIGIGMLWEVVRWEHWLDAKAGEEFKLNNNYRSRYARLIMENEPDLAGVFELRKLTA